MVDLCVIEGEKEGKLNTETYRGSTLSSSESRLSPKIPPTPNAMPPRKTRIMRISDGRGELRKHRVQVLSSTLNGAKEEKRVQGYLMSNLRFRLCNHLRWIKGGCAAWTWHRHEGLKHQK